MRRFEAAQASGEDAASLVDACLDTLGEVPPDASFGFVYATDALAGELSAVCAKLVQRTGVRHWAGTVGLGITCTGREIYDEPALALMVADFPDEAFRMLPPRQQGLEAFLADEADWLARDAFHFGVVHGDPTNPETPSVVGAVAENVPGAFLVGGLTSSNSGVNAQVAGDVGTGGVSGVVFDSTVPVVTGHTQGCTPMGEHHVITACHRNVVLELDGRPALDVLKADVGEVLARDLSRLGGYVFAGLPIPGSDTGDYLVRNLVGIDPEQGFVAVGDLLTEGTELMFCRRDGNSAREDMERMLVDIAARMGDSPRGAVYVSCLGRGRHQFGEDSEELRLIRDAIGDVPLVGFFANGEIFHNRLYGYTGVLTVFC